MSLNARTPHLSLPARRCLILSTFTALLLIPALQAAVGGFFVTDLSAAGLVALALISGTRYLGGHTVRTHRPGVRLAVCAVLLAASVYELVTLSSNRPDMGTATLYGVTVTPLLLTIGLWVFTARQTRLGEPPVTPEPPTEATPG